MGDVMEAPLVKTFTFQGHSDDVFCYQIYQDGRTIDSDEMDDCAAGAHFMVHLRSESQGELVVVGRYSPGKSGTWMIGLMPTEEGMPIPEWDMSWLNAANGYSPQLVLQTPDDTVIVSAEKVMDRGR